MTIIRAWPQTDWTEVIYINNILKATYFPVSVFHMARCPLGRFIKFRISNPTLFSWLLSVRSWWILSLSLVNSRSFFLVSWSYCFCTWSELALVFFNCWRNRRKESTENIFSSQAHWCAISEKILVAKVTKPTRGIGWGEVSLHTIYWFSSTYCSVDRGSAPKIFPEIMSLLTISIFLFK